MTDQPLTNRLREMILSEELAPGERITEAGLAARLGVSRTPVRNILPGLAAEGLLSPVGKRGYAVASFSDQATWEALELRAYLEGFAGRLLAEKGVSNEVMAQFEACLAQGDSLFEKHHLDLDDEHKYGEMNARFHQIIVDACDSPMLKSFIDRLNRIPFVTPSVVVFDMIGLRRAFDRLFVSHGCHHAIVEAIRQRDATRVEALFREHGNQQRLSVFSRRAAKYGLPAAIEAQMDRTRVLRQTPDMADLDVLVGLQPGRGKIGAGA